MVDRNFRSNSTHQMISHFTHPTIQHYRQAAKNVDRTPVPNADSSVPKVSMVTSTFNSCETLAETIASVRSQNYPNLEYIVVDGNSNDGTAELIAQNRDLISVYCRESDDGIYDGINKGIGLATGAVVKITNADDLLTPSSISRAMEALASAANPQKTIVNSYLNIINHDSEIVDLFTDRWIVDSVPAFLHPSWYVPIEVYRDLGLYSLDLQVASDYEYYLYSRQDCKYITLTEPLCSYRTDGRSSGLEGMHEAIRISRSYLAEKDATKIARTYWMQKLRKKVLQRVIGDRGFYFLKKLLRRHSGTNSR